MKSRYFTSKLTMQNRQAILRILGLESFRFLLFEAMGDVFLRVQENCGEVRKTLLEPATMNEAKTFISQYSHPILYLQHGASGRQLPVQSPLETLSLWEEIIPFPISIFSRGFSSIDSAIKIEPERVREAFSDLFVQLQKLEEKMAETELSILWLHNEQVEMPLLLHYVRKRRIHVGISDVLPAITQLHREGRLTEEMLLETFGTQTAFFNLDLAQSFESTCPIARLKSVVEAALEPTLQAKLTSHQSEPIVTFS